MVQRSKVALLVIGPLDGTQLVGEAVVEHHLTCDVRCLLDVVGSTGGRIMEHDLLRGTTAHGVRHLVEQLVARHGIAIFRRHHRGVAERTATRQNGDLGDRIGIVHGGCHQRVTTLVVCGIAQFVERHALGTALRPRLHAVDSLVDGAVVDQLRTGAGAQQCGFVQHIGQISTGKARRTHGNHTQINVRHERLALGMHLQNSLAAFQIRRFDGHLTIETAGTQQSGIKHVGAVGRRDDDQIGVVIEAVHLNQQLVQSLLTFIMATAHAGTATLTTDGIDLIDEDDGRSVLLGLIEQVTHTRGAKTHEHFHEVGACHGVERHAGLACDGSCQQCLTGTWRTVEQHATRNTGTQSLVTRRILQEVLDFLDFLHGSLFAGHVGELGGRGLTFEQLAAVLLAAHAEHAAGTAHTTHHEPEQTEDNEERQQRGQQIRPNAALLHGRRPALGRIGLFNGLDHGGGLRVRVVELHALAVVLHTPGIRVGSGVIALELELDLLGVVYNLRVFNIVAVEDLQTILGVDGLGTGSGENLEHGHGKQCHNHNPQPWGLPERTRTAIGSVAVGLVTLAVGIVAIAGVIIASKRIGERVIATVVVIRRLARTRKTHA